MKNFFRQILTILGLVKPSPQALEIIVAATPAVPVVPATKKKSKQRRSAHQRKITNLRARAREIFWANYRGEMDCGYCGEQTSRNLPEDHPLRATVEHLVPLSKGGTNKPKNMMLACFKCNQLEAAKKDFVGRSDMNQKIISRQRNIDSKYYGKVSDSK